MSMRLTSRTIASLLAAAGTGFAVSAMIGAPVAVAQVPQDCPYPGQEKIDGTCRNVTPVPAPPGGDQKVVCTQHSCTVFNE